MLQEVLIAQFAGSSLELTVVYSIFITPQRGLVMIGAGHHGHVGPNPSPNRIERRLGK